MSPDHVLLVVEELRRESEVPYTISRGNLVRVLQGILRGGRALTDLAHFRWLFSLARILFRGATPVCLIFLLREEGPAFETFLPIFLRPRNLVGHCTHPVTYMPRFSQNRLRASRLR